ncbi:MAG: helix-turn-helix domain-containing protein [Bryobacteraceae bacterium]
MHEYESGSDTISRVLSAYDLGSKLRQLRMRKKIALTELGKHTGLSASMLSQLENGKLIPTLPTLARVAMVFDVGLDYFFGTRRRAGLFEVVRKEERMRFSNDVDAERPGYYFEVLAFKANNKPIEAYLAEFPQRESPEAVSHAHAGAELVHVLEGRLEVVYQDDTVVLEAGDSAYFDATEVHSYRGLSEPPARAVVISAAMVG